MGAGLTGGPVLGPLWRPGVAGRMPEVGGSQDQRVSEERALFARLATDGDPRHRKRLTERVLPLARSLALRSRRSGEPLDDLLQVASLGLIKAIDGFDPDRKIP